MIGYAKARRLGGGFVLRPAPVRFEALDSWRGIAALMVVLFHAQIASHVYDAGLVRAGDAFVDFFFVLSGFVIAHAYGERLSGRDGLPRFLFLRLGRLYPLHLFMLLLFLAFEVARACVPMLGAGGAPAFSDGFTLSSLVANLLMLQAFWPADHLTWNAPSWSISAELLAYGLFGCWLAVAARSRVTLGLAAAALIAPLLLALFSARGMETAAGLGWARAIHGFALGALLYRLLGGRILQARERAAGFWRWTAAEAAAAGGSCAAAVAAHATGFAFAVPLCFAVAVAVFAVEGGGLSRVLKWRPMLFLGAISYSIYLTHLFILARFSNGARLAEKVFGLELLKPMGDAGRGGVGIDVGSLFAGDALVVVMLACVVLASWATWRWIELPGQALFKAWSGRLLDRAPAVQAANEKGRLREAAL